jgi:hypothetical protein
MSPWHLTLLHGYRFIALEEVLEARADTLEIMPAGLVAALGGPPRQRQDKPGRPTNRSIVPKLFANRQRACLTLTGVRAEAEAICKQMREQHSDLETPAVRTVENIIRAEHIAWHEANARRTK